VSDPSPLLDRAGIEEPPQRLRLLLEDLFSEEG
jgi:hypothetical protein